MNESRRDFFTQAKSEILSKNILFSGWISAFLKKDEPETQKLFYSQSGQLKFNSNLFEISFGEPINQKGEPFGDSVADYLVLEELPEQQIIAFAYPKFLEKPEWNLKRQQQSTGISIVSVYKKNKSINITSPYNQKLDLTTPVVLGEKEIQGVGYVTCLAKLPWDAFLFGEQLEIVQETSQENLGWLGICNWKTGSVYKLNHFGRLNPKWIATSISNKLTIYVLSSTNELYKYISKNNIDTERLQNNYNLLFDGQLMQADLANKKWVLK